MTDFWGGSALPVGSPFFPRSRLHAYRVVVHELT
jgi:hypothetical protein